MREDVAMSDKPQRHTGGGWVNERTHPRGPNGRGLCRWCGTEVPKGRRTFCGQECVDQHLSAALRAVRIELS